MFSKLIIFVITFLCIATNSFAREVTIASYYADRFQGRKTSTGEIFDNRRFTAAHRRIRPGTRILVTNLRNNQAVIVRVNDNGPHFPGRGIDLSRSAAEAIGMIDSGLARVSIVVLNDVE